MIDETADIEFIKDSRKPQKLIKEVRVNSEKESSKNENSTRDLDLAQRKLIHVYKKENLVPVRVAPSYAKHLGRVMRVSINGVSVAIRCDGNTVKLPESFAAEVLRRMSEIDKIELRQNKMANVTRNFESSPGQLNFFG